MGADEVDGCEEQPNDGGEGRVGFSASEANAGGGLGNLPDGFKVVAPKWRGEGRG